MGIPISSQAEEGHVSPFRSILVPIDGSDASIRAAQIGVQMASVHGLPLIVLYVIDENNINQVSAASMDSIPNVRRQMESKGWSYLEHIARMARNYGVTCERLLRSGISHSQIAEVAREHNVDLIVMGEERLRSARRTFIGSVTERVIEYAPCMVLVVKPT